MKFIKVKSSKENHISLAMIIDNYTDLQLFLKDRAKDLAKAYMECQDSVLKFGSVTHTSRLALVVGMTLEKIEDRKNFVDDIVELNNVLLKPYIDTFNKFGGFYAWKNVDKWEGLIYKYSSLTPITPNILDSMKLVLIETIERDDLIFPDIPKLTVSDISIKKWEGGKHYYAKVGEYDVEMNGERKWNTYEYAEQVAKQFLYEKLDKHI